MKTTGLSKQCSYNFSGARRHEDGPLHGPVPVEHHD